MINISNNENISLINVIYHRPKKYDGEKYSDAVTLIYKDNITGEKYSKFIENPDYEYYKVINNATDYNLLYADEEDVEKIRVKYKDLDKKIAEDTGNTEFFYENIRNGTRGENRMLHTHPIIMRSDMHIEDYYRYLFTKEYGNNDMNIHKSYFDIEADVIDIKGDFPEPGECPVNATTYLDAELNKSFTFLLRNKDNPLIEELEKELNNNPTQFFDDIHSSLLESMNGMGNILKYGLDKIEYNIYFYDNEIDMLVSIFRLINSIKPDFLMAWNMGFDIPFIIERCKVLGYDPSLVMCSDEFPIKECRYWIDERNLSEFHKRGDKAVISSHTVYVDQMIHFASRRTGQALFKNYKLDYIADVIAGVRKLDYSHITNSIAELPYKNYRIFVIYNIIDTMAQKCIEDRVEDIKYIYTKSMMNHTRYDKVHRNTIYLKNRGTSEFEKHGKIIGNNANLNIPKETFAGGLVADPLLNEDNGIVVNGNHTSIRGNGTDYDYKSLYPSMIREFNIGPNTAIGRIIINNLFRDTEENELEYKDYDRSGAFIHDFVSRNYLILGRKWFNLAGYSDLYDDVLDYVNNELNIFYGVNNGFQAMYMMRDGQLPQAMNNYVNMPHAMKYISRKGDVLNAINN